MNEMSLRGEGYILASNIAVPFTFPSHSKDLNYCDLNLNYQDLLCNQFANMLCKHAGSVQDISVSLSSLWAYRQDAHKQNNKNKTIGRTATRIKGGTVSRVALTVFIMAENNASDPWRNI